MFPAKPLACGVAAVGSVSTAAVVANQYGLFSSTSAQSASGERTEAGSDASTSSGDALIPVAPQNHALPPTPAIDSRTNKEKITKWLSDNGVGVWIIKVKTETMKEAIDLNSIANDSDLTGLLDYLKDEERKDPLTSLLVYLETHTLTFEKTSDNWKHLLTKEQINNWVKAFSGDLATLKIAESNQEKTNFTNDESTVIFKAIHGDYSKFSTNLSTASTENKKTILFEKVGDDWKHSKTEIDGWLSDGQKGNNKFDLKIKKEGDPKPLNETDEGDLIGLLNYLEGEKSNLLKFKNPVENQKADLILKKETNWDVVHRETTINNWVSNTSSTRVTLKLKKGEGENKPTTDAEWKKLFDSISNSKNSTLFNNSDSETTKEVIFEKAGEEWKHIKDALTELLTTKGKTELKIQISKDGTPTELSGVEDKDLIGLYQHINTKSSDLDNPGANNFVVFKKDGTTWSRDKSKETAA